MTRSKRSLEGWLMIDHRNSPGLPDEMMPFAKDMPARCGQGLFEAPTYTCGHCPQVVVMNPLRTRERGYCRKCDHYICDKCNGILHTTRTCIPYIKVIEVLQEHNFMKDQRGSSDEQEIIRNTNINAHSNR